MPKQQQFVQQPPFINEFFRGLNTDADSRNQPEGTYRGMVNMSLTGSGGFYSPENIKGSLHVADFLLAGSYTDFNILGAYECYPQEADFTAYLRKHIITFLAFKDNVDVWHSRIFFFNTEINLLTQALFGDTEPSDTNRQLLNFPATGSVDAVIFGERGFSSIYFEDNLNPLRKLECTLGAGGVPTVATVRSLSVSRYNPIDDLRYENPAVSSGGSLPSGSYQFAYAYYNTAERKQTAWSALTNPIPIWPDTVPEIAFGPGIAIPNYIGGGLPGEATQKQIHLLINEVTSGAYASFYDSLILAVVKHITGTKEPAQVAFVTDPFPIVRTSFVIRFTYSGNGTERSVDIAEIVTPDAAILHAKTLIAKDNVLFRGSITYADRLLDFDADLQPDLAAQEITQNVGCPIISAINGNYGYKTERNCANYRGYFRNETYRLARVYVDEFNNESNPIPFDFTGIGGQGGIDWHFSDRRTQPILSQTDDDPAGVMALGLRISGIKNHPSWAKTLRIARVSRLKNILAQAPHIPMVGVMPRTAVADSDPSASTVNDAYSSAIPGTFLPKILMEGAARNILRDTVPFVNGATPKQYLQDFSDPASFHAPILASLLLAPEWLFNENATSQGAFYDVDYAGKVIKIIDAASFARSDLFPVDGVTANGTLYSDRVAVHFGATNAAQYYYKSPSTPLFTALDLHGYFPADVTATIQLVQKAVFGEGNYTVPLAPMGGNAIMGNILNVLGGQQVSLYNKGNVFSTQRGLLAILGIAFGDMDFLAGPSGGTYFETVQFGSAANQVGPTHFNPTQEPTEFFGNQIEEAPPDHLSTAGFTTAIVNIEAGLGQGRYGGIKTPYSFQYTGTQVDLTALTDDEIANGVSVDVWGGDCFITHQYAKVNDTHLFLTTDGTRALADAEEVISCYLESEVNCELGAQKFIFPRQLIASSLPPFSNEFRYDYNFGYSVQNTLKSYAGRDFNAKKQLSLPARFIFSDQKVYQSTIEGFDRYRIASYYDLDESFGGITKLIKDNDNRVYALQERAVLFIPINEAVQEFGKGERTLINSNVLVNIPQFVYNNTGCQHIRAVVLTDEGFAFVDFKQREIHRVAKGDRSKISDKGRYGYFNDQMYPDTFPEKDLFLSYDFNNQQLVFSMGANHQLWDDRADEGKGAWTHSLNTPGDIRRYVFAGKSFYALGRENSNNISIHQLYFTGNLGQLMGFDTDSAITFIVNPLPSTAKTFDTLALDSTDRSNEAQYTATKQDNSDFPQTVTMNLYQRARQVLYEYPVGRDAVGGRLRGFYATVVLITTNKDAANGIDYRRVRIKSVISKYRLSQRTI